MPPARPPKAVTPGSVKGLMVVEAGIIGFLSFWVTSEYAYNIYFQSYVNSVFFEHITTYTAVIGLSVGLAGSFATLTLYRNLKQARLRLEMRTFPRIGGMMDRVAPNLSSLDELGQPPTVQYAGSEGSLAQSPANTVADRPLEQKN